MHRRTEAMAELKAAIVRYATDRIRIDPPPLDGPRTLAELRAAAGAHDHPGGHRRAGGAAHLRRRARPGVHLRRPPPVPVVRAGGTDRGGDPVRPRRRRVEHLRRLVVGGRRCRVRRERGAALDRRPRRHAARGRRRVRQRRHGRQPERTGRRPLALAIAGERRPRPHPWAAADVEWRPLVRRPGRPGDGRRRRHRARRRRRPAEP